MVQTMLNEPTKEEKTVAREPYTKAMADLIMSTSQRLQITDALYESWIELFRPLVYAY